MKVVLNKSFGGFWLSSEVCEQLGIKWHDEISRNDERLIKLVEELGNEVSPHGDSLEIVEIPDDSYWLIDEYDGMETLYYSSSEIFTK